MKVFVLLAISLSLVSGQKCRALAMSGGGAYGAYEAGVFTGLVNSLPPSEVAYDIIMGISAGSLNTLGLSMFAQGQEVQASQFVQNIWLDLNGRDDVISDWPGGLLAGLTIERGLYDTTPLYNYLKKNAVMPPARNALVGTTSLNTGQYVLFKDNGTIQQFIDAAMASSAIQGVFPPVIIGNDVFCDGAVTVNSDPMTAIEECLKITNNEADVIIDMISCYNNSISIQNTNMLSLDVNTRAKEIRSYSDDLKYLSWALSAYPGVNFRYYLQPSQKLPLNSELDFSHTGLQGSIDIGISDASNAVKNNIYMAQVLPNLFDTIYI